MLFREIVFKDFLVFKGENKITFPAPKDAKASLLLVLAPNSGGKTSVIRSLEFLLYGKLRREMPPTLVGLVNKAAIKESAEIGTVEAWVQATIEVAGEPRTIRRRIEAKRTGSNYRFQVHLEETIHARIGDKFREDQGEIQRLLDRLVPESLFNYFYFQGETLAQELIRGTENQAIRDGLATLLHQDKWEAATATVEMVRKKVSAEMQNLEDASQDHKAKAEGLEQIREFIRRNKSECAEWRTKEVQAEADFNAAEEQIKILGSGTSHERINADLAKRRHDSKAAEKDLERIEGQIATLVAESKGLPFFKNAFAPGLAILEEMKEENILPADVSDGFVSRILGGTKCICGRPLAPESEFSEQRHCIESYRARTLAIDINSGLLTLLNSLHGGTRQSFEVNIENINLQAPDLLSKRDEALLRVNDLDEAVKSLEHARAKSNIDAIVEQQAKQRKASDIRAMAKGKQCELQTQVATLELREREYKRELTEMGADGAGSKLIRLHRIRERSNQLQKLIEHSLEHLKSSFHEVLQLSATKYYDNNVTDNSRAHIHPQSLLPLIKRNGEVLHTLGGGQRQLLVLAHIISLAELRRSLHAQLDAIGIKTGKLDDQSFFLDSVFAPCDEEYARVVAHFLPGKARQMMILLATQQWHKTIRQGIEGAVDRAYVFKLHTNNPEANVNNYSVQFGARTLNLIQKIPVDQEPFSTIEEIK
jgi:DNA sulfur modification protein DndD